MLATQKSGFLLSIVIFISSLVFGQESKFKGIVYNEKGMAIPWVNIGIKNKNLGTTSTEDGVFELKISSDFREETIVFSSVGYEDLNLPVNELTDLTNKIVLKSKITQLNEVVISNKKSRKVTLGTRGYTPLMWVSVSLKDNDSYVENGKLIHVKKPAKLLNANVSVGKLKDGKDSVSYRLNFYKVKNGYPGERLFEKSIIQTFSNAVSRVTINLEKYNMYVDEDFVVSFELLRRKANLKTERVSFRANITAGDGFFRDVSNGSWRPMKGGSGAIYVQVMQ